ncbi:MAG: hypothetical protein CL678_03245 [Bdellovibrionaceae bacterium]|nr:hypothetical protein [Pseudobdellovibrionaceae bacterium]
MENQTQELKNFERNIFGSFSIGENNYAISVKSIQEVVNEPQEYTPMPLSPSYLLGLFNLRGSIIPVIDLKKIFELNHSEENVSEKKIAIIEHGKQRVGILFDKTGEVFNGNDYEKSDFNTKGENIKEQVVQGVFKMDDGKKIIQIIDPIEVLNLDKVPYSTDHDFQEESKKQKGKRAQCISFTVGDSRCSLNIEAIQEIIKIDKIENTALSSNLCLGAIDIRGNTIPVVDFSCLLGYGKNNEIDLTQDKNNKVIVMKIDRNFFGLLVSSVESIISYYEEDIMKFPVLSEKKKNMFEGCIRSQSNQETILLDHKQILSNQEVETITRGHSNLYKEKSDVLKEEDKKSINLKTYITFSIQDHYALQIDEVKEVINLPEKFLNPPNLSKHFKGMINLRGDLVAVIDPRVLYEMKENTSPIESKVMIFSLNQIKFGLMVDSVDSILTFDDNKKINIPSIIYQGKAGSLSEDVKEAVEFKLDDSEAKKTLMILNLISVASRAHLNNIEQGAA